MYISTRYQVIQKPCPFDTGKLGGHQQQPTQNRHSHGKPGNSTPPKKDTTEVSGWLTGPDWDPGSPSQNGNGT